MANETVIQEDPNEAPASVVPESSFCSALRSKKFFMIDALPTEASQYLDASNHCWCRMTQQVIGPDGGSVHPESCVAGRDCYRSAFEA
ncbi:MAG: hypothetical protein QOG23_40 [Blastocatellia bacterium]|jgi:hypothetical protein|nr:hypothetical protein [Blastocatellia bacterium]